MNDEKSMVEGVIMADKRPGIINKVPLSTKELSMICGGTDDSPETDPDNSGLVWDT